MLTKFLLPVFSVLVLGAFGISLRAEEPKKSAAINLTLNKAVELALKQNPEILRSLQEIQRTHGQVIEIRALALPLVAAVSNYNQQDKDLLESSSGGGGGISIDTPTGTETIQSSQGSSRGGDKNWRVAVEVKQMIYSGGQTKAAIKIAKLTEDSSYFALRDTVDRVISLVRQQFYNVLLNKALIVVAEESIALLSDELKDQKNRFDAGTVPRFNVLRAEVELANAQPDLISAKNDYLISQLELAKTLGVKSAGMERNVNFEPTGELIHNMGKEIALEVALKTARENRAFLKVQRNTMEQEEQQIKLARSGYKPRLDANAGYEMRNSRQTDDLSKETNGWFAGVTGSWNIFDGFETKGKVIQAKARLESAKVNYEDSIQQVELEVQKAYANVLEAKEFIASQQKTVEQANEALRLSRERLDAGAGTQLEVLDARVALTTARTNEYQARFNYLSALAELDRAMGADTHYDDSFVCPELEPRKPKKETQETKKSAKKKKLKD